jgi:hypothetical protein
MSRCSVATSHSRLVIQNGVRSYELRRTVLTVFNSPESMKANRRPETDLMSQWTYKNGPRQSDVVTDATLCRMIERGDLSLSSQIRELPKGPWVYVRDTHFAAIVAEPKRDYFTPISLSPTLHPSTIVYTRSPSQRIARTSLYIGFAIAGFLYLAGLNGFICFFIGIILAGGLYGERLKTAAYEKIVDRYD